MKLGERLRQGSNGNLNADAEAHADVEVTPAAKPKNSPSERPKKAATTSSSKPAPVIDPLDELKQRAQEALFQQLGARLYDSSMNEEQLRTFVGHELETVLEADQTPLSPAERTRLVASITDDVIGHGPIEQFLADDDITEVMVSGTNNIYVERDGRLYEMPSRFLSDDHLRRVIERIVTRVGRRIDESSPMVDARLPDGSRVNAMIPPLAVDGPNLTIRKFSKDPYEVDDLKRFGTFTSETADFLQACVEGRLNILISGGTGSGKTTLLNVMSGFIPTDQRIVTIEDAVELQLHQDHVIRLEARPANIEGRGEVTIRDLVRNALRMRPDRIVVGEVRSGEALDMLQAMNTGHDGSLSTVHANSPRDAMARIETMVLMAGMELPMKAIREQIASAVHLIVQVARLRDGSRKVMQISEVEGFEGQVITLSDLFAFDFGAGLDADGRFLGSVKPTGLRPRFSDHLHDLGIELPASLFGAEGA